MRSKLDPNLTMNTAMGVDSQQYPVRSDVNTIGNTQIGPFTPFDVQIDKLQTYAIQNLGSSRSGLENPN
jgi:hypothetical protein